MAIELEQKLNSLDGFKKVFTGIFGGGKAKKSFEIYSSADFKGVYPLHKLRIVAHGEFDYAIYAFTTEDSISSEILRDLTEKTMTIDIGTIRYECLTYTRLDLWRGKEESHASANTIITDLALEYPNIFVFPVAEQVNCSYVIYAYKAGNHYVYPLSMEQANKLR